MVYVPQIRPNIQRNGSGWWPDPLVPVSRAIGVAGEATPLWFTVHAPAHASSGRRVYHATIAITEVSGPTSPSAAADATAIPDAATITIPVQITVFGFSLPTTPTLMTAFNLDEAKIGAVYHPNASSGKVPLADVKAMWERTGCSNPFSKTVGEQPLWQSLSDGGAADMFDYCSLTREGKASPGQLVVCVCARVCVCVCVCLCACLWVRVWVMQCRRKTKLLLLLPSTSPAPL